MELLEYLKFYHIEFGVFPKFNIIVLIRLVRFPGAAGHKRTTLFFLAPFPGSQLFALTCLFSMQIFPLSIRCSSFESPLNF